MRVLRTLLFLLGVLATKNLARTEPFNDEVVQQKFRKNKWKQNGGNKDIDKKTVDDYKKMSRPGPHRRSRNSPHAVFDFRE